MTAREINRRDFIHASAALTAGCYVGPTMARVSYSVAIRPDVGTFSASSQNMLTYARAVKEMRARSSANLFDPLGWSFWANIHGMPATDRNNHATWRQCDHGTRWFFPWHRGYLMFFERAIRKVSGDNSFVLPYWKWDDSAARSLPALFRMPMHPDLKELFHARFPPVNAGDALPNGPFDVDLPNAMEETSFDHVSSIDPGFSRYLDNSPHGAVHDDTGGEMGSITTSARDPIFWLHHANVDRLWNRWLDKGMGRMNPTDAVWLDTPLRTNGAKKPIQFPDENGVIVQMTVQEVMNMAKASYRYDDDSTIPVAAAGLTATTAGQGVHQEAISVGSASNNLFMLSDKQSSVSVQLGSTGSERLKHSVKRMMASGTAPKRSPVFLELQGVQIAAADPGVNYDVLIKPKGSDQGGQYVGNLNFFSVHGQMKPGGMDHAASDAVESLPKFDVSYNISKAVRQLSNDGNKVITELEVIFKPSKRSKNAKALPKIGFERIVIQAAR
jgi:hypothetical protein